jgi:hypothetical protein
MAGGHLIVRYRTFNGSRHINKRVICALARPSKIENVEVDLVASLIQALLKCSEPQFSGLMNDNFECPPTDPCENEGIVEQ